MNIIPAYAAENFKEIEIWSDGQKHSIDDFKGKVILLDFWTYTCVYCLRTIPTMDKIKEKYEEKGLVIIQIHSSEYEFGTNPSNIRKAISALNLNDYIIGFDTKNKTWEAYGNSYWPKHILIDRDGFVRYEHPGYGIMEEFEESISDLLDIPYSNEEQSQKNGKESDDNQIARIYGMHFLGMAPEVCLGYSRIRRFGNNQKLKVNDFNILTEPNTIFDNNVYLRGKWRWDKERIKPSLEYKEKDPAIIFRYNMASNVNIIVGPDDSKPAVAEIKLDGKYLEEGQFGSHIKIKDGISYVEVFWPFIYNVIKTKNIGTHKIEIIPRSNNFCFYTFVFG
jgi:thiol-disulfide isomerase/thioredoxin